MALTWKEEAAQLGIQAARSAASWVTDGNESDESRRVKLNFIASGSPLMDEFMDPLRPQPNAEEIIETVTGKNANEVPMEIREELLNTWEDAVSDEFETACEEELRRWVS